jgi:HAT1-interacting factor 1
VPFSVGVQYLLLQCLVRRTPILITSRHLTRNYRASVEASGNGSNATAGPSSSTSTANPAFSFGGDGDDDEEEEEEDGAQQGEEGQEGGGQGEDEDDFEQAFVVLDMARRSIELEVERLEREIKALADEAEKKGEKEKERITRKEKLADVHRLLGEIATESGKLFLPFPANRTQH